MAKTKIAKFGRLLVPDAFSLFRLRTGSFGEISPLFYLCTFVVVAGLILGGGTRHGFLSDTILQLLSVPLLLVSIWKLVELPLTKQARLALWFCVAIALLPILQLVPLPPWLWTALPNRQPSVEAFQLLAKPVPWMPISVSPQATWLSALSIIPPIAIFLGTILLTYRERRLLTLVIVALGILSVFLGLIQVAQGRASSLRFFEITNPLEAVGFFANRNHFAALLYCLIPFVLAWTLDKTAGSVSNEKREPALGSFPALSSYNVSFFIAAIAGFTALVIILAGELTARSRAGLGLAIVALFSGMALSSSNRHKLITPNKIIVGAIVIAVVFSLQYGFYRVLERYSDFQRGDRVQVALTTLEAAKAYMPVGAGLGTFRTVYPMFEKPEQVSLYFVNRAHNDILELSLETGVVGPILMGLFAVWLVRRSVQSWRDPPPGASALDWSLVRAGAIVVALLIAHSFVDYPLRTGAMMTIMAFTCALLIEPLGGSAYSPEERGKVTGAIPPSDPHELESTAQLRHIPKPPAKPIEPAKSLEELQAALHKIGQNDPQRLETFAPRATASLASKPAKRVKSPEELQAALNKIRQPNMPASPPPEPLPSNARQSETPRLEFKHPAILTPSTSSTPSQPAGSTEAVSIPPERRWGTGIEWPGEWSKTPKKIPINE